MANFAGDVGLLDTPTSVELEAGDFNACLNARGTYTTDKFVLRLNPQVHRLVDAAVAAAKSQNGLIPAREITADMVFAYSTYLHETVHWWQHVGSTSGLITSFQIPAIVHENSQRLANLVEGGVNHKPIKSWAESKMRSGDDSELLSQANTIVNNAIDAMYYRYLSFKPKNIFAASEDRYFESMGHSYWISYIHAVALMQSTFDSENKILPGVKHWEDSFK
ncbi:hypothetical protein PQU92_02670 [Asticcacaulis sp. BYS171W]|uniref:Uncharacterized protein n=1 Tax=Asticcacaulis aquaticus TaxID=2984212 RepID=A0ABT5HRT3_9CAUL|nr:hypothetical protein [Asticcacaulis aquaticus]MDC7682161.1 hypothetical protein [Asticcacaulis aquaticus]